MTEETSEEIPESSKSTKIFAGVGLVVILLIIYILVFGIKPKPPALNTVEYNYFTFTEVGAGLWETDVKVKGTTYTPTFRFHPEQVENVSVSGELSPEFNRRPIHVTFDPIQHPDNYKYLALAASELGLSLIRGLNKTLISACTMNESDACLNKTIVTCDDANKSVIYLRMNETEEVQVKGDCIILQGEGMNLLKSVDRLLFQWFRIMR